MRARGRRQPSSIDRLGPEINALIAKLRIDHGWTIDEILEHLKTMGAKPSRSALGRKVKSIEEVGAQLRHSREVANALVQELGDAPEDKTAQLNIELMHSMILRLITATNDKGDGQPITFGPEDTMFLTRSLQALAGARKTNADTILKVRQVATEEAAKRAGVAATAAGLSAKSVADIRRAVLGSDA